MILARGPNMHVTILRFLSPQHPGVRRFSSSFYVGIAILLHPEPA